VVTSFTSIWSSSGGRDLQILKESVVHEVESLTLHHLKGHALEPAGADGCAGLRIGADSTIGHAVAGGARRLAGRSYVLPLVVSRHPFAPHGLRY
jgi:hypothetical protein